VSAGILLTMVLGSFCGGKFLFHVALLAIIDFADPRMMTCLDRF